MKIKVKKLLSLPFGLATRRATKNVSWCKKYSKPLRKFTEI